MALSDTYVAALQHDLVDLPDGAIVMGVVRRPTRWFHPHVDDNLPALGPPPELLDDFRNRREALVEEGLSDPAAHDAAWEDVEYDERYLDYLDTSGEAREALSRVRRLLDAGEDVALVCYENTDEKRCHRTLLREYLTGATA